jgi:hypothetical protein
MDYMKLDFDFGTANAGKTFECTLFSWDLVYRYNPDLVDTPPEYIPPLGSKRAAWSLNNPAQWCVDNNYPIGYDTNGMPPELAAAVLDLNPVMGLRAELRGDAYVYSSTFSIVADASGQVTLYGWADMSSWVGNQHLPFNGFTVVPEPITVTLLGLGGLAVLQKRKR